MNATDLDPNGYLPLLRQLLSRLLPQRRPATHDPACCA